MPLIRWSVWLSSEFTAAGFCLVQFKATLAALSPCPSCNSALSLSAVAPTTILLLVHWSIQYFSFLRREISSGWWFLLCDRNRFDLFKKLELSYWILCRLPELFYDAFEFGNLFCIVTERLQL